MKMSFHDQDITQVLKTVSGLCRGPGGAVAVLKDGNVVGQHVWGFADLNKRIPMTAQTQMPVCSITKQMLCALLLDLERHPTPAIVAKGNFREQLAAELKQLLRPELTDKSGLTIDHLCNNQSGIRDYWAMTTLWGARPESRFSLETDASPMLDRLRTLHFRPGDEFSYANTNFHIVARLIERVAETPLGALLADRVFNPAEMKTASLCPDTAQQPPPCIGYEGSEENGYVPALNSIEWSGDAGIVASLDDMVAYEQFFDRNWAESSSWCRDVSKATTYNDGSPARYRLGLVQIDIEGVTTFGHGGALRGYRLHRLYAPRERLSVVVMLNHEADAKEFAELLLKRVLKLPEPKRSNVEAAPDWFGCYLDEETLLAVTVRRGETGQLKLIYAGYPEPVTVVEPKHAESRNMVADIDGSILHVDRLGDNRVLRAQRILQTPATVSENEWQGDYECAEIGSIFHCSGQGIMLYGAFEGFLGDGPALLMRRLGDDVWALSCPRGLDAPAPGDWTIVLKRDASRRVSSIVIGCWLARRLEYFRIS